MNDLHPTQFFDTTSFPFSSIFAEKKFVWEPLLTLQEYLAQLFTTGKITANYQDRKDVFIGEGSVIDEGVSFVGPVVIGKNCHIGHGALLRDGCLFGNDVHIGHAGEVKHSILLSGAVAAHFNYIGDSIIGSNVNISGGAMTANFRLDKKLISVYMQDKKIETTLQKFGAIIGDNSVIGVNAVLNPGTLLGKSVVVYPLMSVKGTHENGEIIK